MLGCCRLEIFWFGWLFVQFTVNRRRRRFALLAAVPEAVSLLPAVSHLSLPDVCTVFATLTALLIGLLIGPYVIEKLREFQIGQYIREEGPQSHQKKTGTPTMGGVLICISILVPTLLWADLSNPLVWLVMLSTTAFGAIGFADDYIKVVHRRNLGLTARAKLGLQFLASCCVAVALVKMETRGMYSTRLVVPFLKNFRPNLIIDSLLRVPHFWWLAFLPFVIFVMLVISFSSNAVNLTDGLDGLAIGCTIIAAGALTVLTYVSGHAVLATTWNCSGCRW